jgi:hypothetical protein
VLGYTGTRVWSMVERGSVRKRSNVAVCPVWQSCGVAELQSELCGQRQTSLDSYIDRSGTNCTINNPLDIGSSAVELSSG